MIRLGLEYFQTYRRRLMVGFAASTISAVLALMTPFLLRQAIDTFSGVPTAFGWPLHWYALAIVGVALFEAVGRFAARYFVTSVSRLVEFDLRNRFFAHLECLEPSFFLRSRTGDLVARATNDLNAVRQLYGPALFHIFNTGVLALFALVLMFQLSVSLSLWTFLLVPLAFMVFALTRRAIDRRFTRVQEQFGAMADHAQETFAGQRVVKAYAQEDAEIHNFQSISGEYVRRQVAQIRVTGLLWPSMTLILGGMVVILLYLGGAQVVSGALTLGEFVQFNAYLLMLSWPVVALAWVFTLTHQGVASLRRIHQVLSTPPAIHDPPGPSTDTRPIERGEIDFRNVTVEFEGKRVLENISFSVPAGSTLAIVGPLGSGKSVLANLVPRLLDPTEGAVLIDGQDIRTLPVDAVRKSIGHVPQETFLFSGTVRDNVAFGVDRSAPVESRVRNAMRLSRLDSDLDQWPAGIDTVIGERGVTLSGGQKQRTAIARAVAKEPTILILDDALSSVDTKTEEAILRGLREFMAQRTSLVIAHRVSTVRTADRIVVLENGRVVEQGTHASLIRARGHYARMYRRQLIEEELGVEVTEDRHSPVESAGVESRARRRPGSAWEGM